LNYRQDNLILVVSEKGRSPERFRWKLKSVISQSVGQQSKQLILLLNSIEFIDNQPSGRAKKIFMFHSQILAQLKFENETALLPWEGREERQSWVGHRGRIRIYSVFSAAWLSI
jgi:hypothetical protein